MAGTVSASHIGILTAAIVKISYLASSHVFHYLVHWPKGNGSNGSERRDVKYQEYIYIFKKLYLLLQVQISGSGTVLEFYQSLFPFYPGPSLSLEHP